MSYDNLSYQKSTDKLNLDLILTSKDSHAFNQQKHLKECYFDKNNINKKPIIPDFHRKYLFKPHPQYHKRVKIKTTKSNKNKFVNSILPSIKDIWERIATLEDCTTNNISINKHSNKINKDLKNKNTLNKEDILLSFESKHKYLLRNHTNTKDSNMLIYNNEYLSKKSLANISSIPNNEGMINIIKTKLKSDNIESINKISFENYKKVHLREYLKMNNLKKYMKFK